MRGKAICEGKMFQANRHICIWLKLGMLKNMRALKPIITERRAICQIDDNWQKPDKVTSHDLSDAIEALLEEKKPSPNQYPSMGCSIKWKG